MKHQKIKLKNVFARSVVLCIQNDTCAQHSIIGGLSDF